MHVGSKKNLEKTEIPGYSKGKSPVTHIIRKEFTSFFIKIEPMIDTNVIKKLGQVGITDCSKVFSCN